ncbi:hypothetical protein GP486_004421 [Trichoglossum hirsutum]|uniref:Cytochrome b5 heme-binding domain-containing protein n=1 Tax=Trichoglossum hirsutum TaxID=265104 RepID=A0A9P8LB78_9PEZI|nr:hypothetical protein GP486_004421 [Trichoglossum hirsutum]
MSTTTTELTYAEVADHNTKKDLYVVIHDKVYDVSDFVDEHPNLTPIPTLLLPNGVCGALFTDVIDRNWELVMLISDSRREHRGGDEVLLDVAGQDATEAFEDVGHSDEARQILSGFLVAKLKRKPEDPVPKVAPPTGPVTTSSDTAGLGVGLYALVLTGAFLAYLVYRYMQN